MEGDLQKTIDRIVEQLSRLTIEVAEVRRNREDINVLITQIRELEKRNNDLDNRMRMEEVGTVEYRQSTAQRWQWISGISAALTIALVTWFVSTAWSVSRDIQIQSQSKERKNE
jgi:hypothetical protein